MIGDADAIQTRLLGILDQFAKAQHAVLGALSGVVVKIDQQGEGLRAAAEGTGSGLPVSSAGGSARCATTRRDPANA